MLPWKQRLYFWGVHGIFIEVVFTSLWKWCESGDLTLTGHSSLWSFLIYGLGTFLIAEPVYFYLINHQISLILRVTAYVLITYTWEFSWGVLLKSYGANSWDYSHYNYNLYGVITLEYAPFWVICSLVFEFIMSLMTGVEEVPRWKKLK